ncbi:MAG: formylglycine-generating enzyme family protein [Prevotella sp.]|nr:formylglycine-generating enzyme family protein [Prevotella sp.]
MPNRFHLFLLASTMALTVTAQEMTVKSMALMENDMAANLEENLRKDLNGNYGGMVKVHLAASGAQFLGPSVLGQQAAAGSEYWVFMAKDAFKLQVTAPGYLPLEVNFRDHGIEGVEPRRTYWLTILLPQDGNTISEPTPPKQAAPPSKKVFTVNGVSFTMVQVKGGKFKMGATEEQRGDASNSEKPAHDVTLSTFSIGETEVTQALWQAVMGSNPSKYTDNPQNPVESVSYEACLEFIEKLNKLTKKKFRLPTEAEWEYAARGGKFSKHYKYAGSNTCGDVAWMWENSGDKPLSGEWNYQKPTNNNCKPHPVKTKLPNELGLYDMSGNVREWCYDFFVYYKSSSQSNPKGPKEGTNIVFRGGSCHDAASACRVSSRDAWPYHFHDGTLGLRLAL